MANETEIIDALKAVKLGYGIDTAKTIESLFRNETRHFKSGNFLATNGAGMEVGKRNGSRVLTQPYGWGSMAIFWTEYPQFAPNGTFDQVENTSMMAISKGVKTFIKFPSVKAAMMSVAYLINKRGGDGGSWFSINDKAQRDKYTNYLKTIIPKYCNQYLK